MELLFIVGLLALNGIISWWNCKVVGGIWIESKKMGGFMHVLAWCGAVQAAVGFSSVLIFGLAFGAYSFGFLPKEYASAAISLWYLLIIIPAIGTGLVITVHSLITAWRERNIANMGIAAWNTFASGMNIYNALDGIPNAWEAVSSVLGGDSKDKDNDSKAALLILLVVVAIAGGIFITMGLIRHYAAQTKLQPVAA
ncbi:hypothetical protein uan_001 [Pseudomonas phage UAntarctica]|nr:hypothetical protein uan_001 [Pseudomonas phage UAntarctica]